MVAGEWRDSSGAERLISGCLTDLRDLLDAHGERCAARDYAVDFEGGGAFDSEYLLQAVRTHISTSLVRTGILGVAR